METNITNPLEVEARLEDGDAAIAELDLIERELAMKLHVPTQELRRHMLNLLREHKIDETALVARWIATYEVVMADGARTRALAARSPQELEAATAELQAANDEADAYLAKVAVE